MTQPEVSMSTGQAEYNGLVRGCIEVLYLKNLLAIFKHDAEAVVETDSSAAKGIAGRLGANKRTKYFATKLFWMQKLIREGVIKVQKCLGTENESDIGTKPVDGKTLWKIMAKLGMVVLGRAKKAEASSVARYVEKPTGAVYVVEVPVWWMLLAFILGIVMTLMLWAYCNWRGRRQHLEGEAKLKELGIDKMIFAANYGKAHCTRSCGALKRTTQFNEIEWCYLCKKEIIKNLNKVKDA